MSGESMLRFNHAVVGYGSVPIVSCEGLEVASGEFVGIVGPNGAGKSTLLRAITGDAQLQSGEITVGGAPVTGFDARERARAVAVVPQSVTVAFSICAEKFVAMGRHPHLARFTSPGEIDSRVVEESMRLTDTLHLADRPVDALSGGDLQRLSHAQALAQPPRLLLLDEPTSHLDLNHRLQVLDLVRDLASDGMAVLGVFHDLDLAARYSERIAVVANGRVSEAAPPEEVIDAEMLRSVFGVRAVVGIEPVTGSVSVTPVLREGAVASRPRGAVLVIGGSGVSTRLMRDLVLAGWDVRSGALNDGDGDAVLANALGIDFVSIPAFAPMDATAVAAVAELAQGSDAVVVGDVPFGNGNVGNLEACVRSGRPLVLVGQIEGRDYTGGRARELWLEAVAAGATTVETTVGVAAALEALVPDAGPGEPQ